MMDRIGKSMALIVSMWIAGVLFNLALIAGIVWVAAHFIRKLW